MKKYICPKGCQEYEILINEIEYNYYCPKCGYMSDNLNEFKNKEYSR